MRDFVHGRLQDMEAEWAGSLALHEFSDIFLGAPKAITATAHKLARLVYLALKHGMTCVRQTQEEYQAKVCEQQLKSPKKKAKQLGRKLIEEPQAKTAATTTATT